MGVLLVMSACVIPVGYVGVKTFLGKADPQPLMPGFNWVNPLSSVTKMTTQTQIFHFADYVPTQEGVNVYLEASCLMHLEAGKAVSTYTLVGPDYANVVLIPQLESQVREVTSDHGSADLYQPETRRKMTEDLQLQLTRVTAPFGISIESTPISKLTLPGTILDAITTKMGLQQEAEQMEFILDKERQEAERKAIEATGVANYQNIVVSNTTDGMLRFLAIQATEAIAGSCGSKIIMLGERGIPTVTSHKPVGDSTPHGHSPDPEMLAQVDNNLQRYTTPAPSSK